MIKIEYELNVGFAGCGSSGTEEFPNDTTPDQINQYVWEMAQEEASSWEGDDRLYSEEEWQDEDVVASFYEGAEGTWEYVTDED